MVRSQNDSDKPLMLQKYLARLLEKETHEFDDENDVEDNNNDKHSRTNDYNESQAKNSKRLRNNENSSIDNYKNWHLNFN